MGTNRLPSIDGDVNIYANDEAKKARWYNASKKAIFINGMDNQPKDHKKSAEGLSLLQMCPVVGVYNKTSGKVLDLIQCLGDKYQFDGPAASSANAVIDAVAKQEKENGRSANRVKIIEGAIERNPACLSLFRVLRRKENRHVPIYAHSQGNLILSNALSAVAAADGEGAIKGRKVHSFGSPAVNWPSGLNHQEYGFTFDPVSWLSGFDFSFSISKLGPLKGENGGSQLWSHAFDSYMRNDPAFVINRFRWGGWGVTVSMDEDGLAAALADMGRNIPRVLAVFERLERENGSDVDDVAVRYVNNLRKKTNSKETFQMIKSSKLHSLLVRVMEEGWTGSDERKAIDYLQAI